MSEAQDQELVFKALANEVRREILDLLKAKPLTTGELCAHFTELDRCTVMLHLDVLENADLVIVRRKGKHRWNYLNVSPILGIYDRWISQYATHSARLLARLKSDLEGE
jgi:DNA-binding transcriptional ArsR family regulator